MFMSLFWRDLSLFWPLGSTFYLLIPARLFRPPVQPARCEPYLANAAQTVQTA